MSSPAPEVGNEEVEVGAAESVCWALLYVSAASASVRVLGVSAAETLLKEDSVRVGAGMGVLSRARVESVEAGV